MSEYEEYYLLSQYPKVTKKYKKYKKRDKKVPESTNKYQKVPRNIQKYQKVPKNILGVKMRNAIYWDQKAQKRLNI